MSLGLVASGFVLLNYPSQSHGAIDFSGQTLEAGGRVAALQSKRPQIATEEVERLKALGYLDHSEEAPQSPGQGTVFIDSNFVSPGYTLVVYGAGCTAELISLDGRVINSWSYGPCRRWDQARLTADGDLVVVGSFSDTQDPVTQQMQESFLLTISWDNELIWRRQLAAHHDVAFLPNGGFLTLLLDRRDIPEVDPTTEVWDNLVARLDSTGNLVEKISLYDVINAYGPEFGLQVSGRGRSHGERWIDLLHCNALETVGHADLVGRHEIYGDDNILITSRSQDTVMVINMRTRELVWHWGRGELSGPHGATVQANGNLLIFDNGLKNRRSRVIEVDPSTGMIVHEYGPPEATKFFSRVMGSNQRLPNGNVLITNSGGGQGIELTQDGRPVWVFMGTRQTADGFRMKIPQMRRIPTDFVNTILDSLA